jgi:hypothetical protein
MVMLFSDAVQWMRTAVGVGWPTLPAGEASPERLAGCDEEFSMTGTPSMVAEH